jgi:ribosomal protein S18 acetylase RimI-like enzyme
MTGPQTRVSYRACVAIAELTVRHGPDGVPDPHEVESLYYAAFSGEPLRESRDVATQFAQLYGFLATRHDLVTAFQRAQQGGGLAGLAYGHPWRWAEQSDAWSRELWDRLGDKAEQIEARFAVYLLAVAPETRRQGLGRTLLRRLLHESGNERAWLITRDEPTPAMTLYEAEGWKPLGHGPDTPNGLPGLILTREDR